MSILSTQNLLGAPAAEQTDFAAYSFSPPMSKRASAAESEEAGRFLYNSPTKSYAPSSDMQAALGQGNFGEGIGADGVSIHKDEGEFVDTKYGPGDAAEGIAPRMTSSDSSLLTGIAKVIANPGTPLSEDYTAKDYFTDRTPRSTRSFRTTTEEGKNGNGSGASRAYYTSASTYPTEILTNSTGAEFVPVIPDAAESVAGTGIFNLIPRTPGGGEQSESHEEVDVPDENESNEDSAAAEGADSVEETPTDGSSGANSAGEDLAAQFQTAMDRLRASVGNGAI